MTHVEDELTSQPECWARAAAEAGRHSGALPARGERVAIVGCGTSYFMAQAAAVLRESAGQGETDAFAASEFPAGRSYDRVVALTRSGTTTEVLDLLGQLKGRTRTTALTADPATPVMAAADEVVVLDFADERSVVQTGRATALAPRPPRPATSARRRPHRAAPLPEGLVGCTQVTFLGSGWTVGLAHEAGLKMREAALAWTEAYPAMEYRHGPISITTTGTATWMLGEAPEGLADAKGSCRMSAAAVGTSAPRADASAAARAAATGLRSLPTTRCPASASPIAWVPIPHEQSRTRCGPGPTSAPSVAACRAMLASQSAKIRW